MVKVLIVEDEMIISTDMTNMLIKMGYEVIGDAINYDEAIEILEETRPDLILLDINLKGEKDGITLAEEINKNYKIPFIYTTSYSDKITLERAKRTEPINYLVKPFKKEQLFTVIELAFSKLAQIEHENNDFIDNSNEALVIKGALFIKEKYKYTKVVIDEILWIKSDGNYLEIHTESNCEIIRGSMDYVMERLDDNKFFRTQKSYIINLDYIRKIETNFVTILTTNIPITKMYHDKLLKKLKVI